MKRGTRTARVAVAVTAAVMAVGVVACGAQVEEAESLAADCPVRVEYDGRMYHDGVTLKDFTVEERLGIAVVPRCDDTGRVGEEPKEGPGQVTGAYRIEGIDPAEALAVGPDRESAVLVVSEGTDPAELAPGP
ncbi:DUF6281 family protein [Streptomyces sp. CO7]